jgi:anti-sigma factor (TIGR02949 family)
MPSCKQVIDLLGEYLDGDLPPSELELFEAHMDKCPPCKAFLRTYKTSDQLARSALRQEEIPAELKERVRTVLKERLGLS